MMQDQIDEIRRVYAEADCLADRAQVETALERMAAAITAQLGERNPLLLTVLTGGIIPAGQLMSRLDFPLQSDYLHATRYRGATEGGELHWLARPRLPLKGRTVLVVDDILDEGYTLKAILEWCRAEGAEAVYSAVLVKKLHDRNCGIEADFVGLEIEDRYLFGYGMDYQEYLRNAPGIYAVKGL